MKEMPERIYLFDCNDAMVTPLEGDTMYVRKDAFIEKVENYLRDKCQRFILTEKDIEDFKKYLEEQA